MTHARGFCFFSSSVMFHLKHKNAECNLRVKKGWQWYLWPCAPLLSPQPPSRPCVQCNSSYVLLAQL